MPDTYAKGQIVRCEGKFEVEATRVLVDPATITFKAKSPTGVLTTYTTPASQIIKDATGKYHVDVNANTAGVWTYRFESSGTYQAADERTFIVEASIF